MARKVVQVAGVALLGRHLDACGRQPSRRLGPLAASVYDQISDHIAAGHLQSDHPVVLYQVAVGGIVAPVDPMIFTGRAPQHGLEDRPPRQKHNVVVSGAEVWTDLPDAASGQQSDNVG